MFVIMDSVFQISIEYIYILFFKLYYVVSASNIPKRSPGSFEVTEIMELIVT